MPHAELKYSNDLSLDAPAILATIDAIIRNHDAGAGDCKGRAYPAIEFNYTHVIAEISMLPKAHRDHAFLNALIADLEVAIKSHLTQPSFFSLKVSFLPTTYVTNHFEP
jgi:hypothetical protein